MKGIAGLALAFVFVVGCSKSADVGVKVEQPSAPVTAAPSTPPVAVTPDPTSATPPKDAVPATSAAIPMPPKSIPAAPGTPVKPPASATASSPPPKTQGTYTFTYAPKVGQSNKYNMTMSMDAGQGKPFDMTSTMSTKVVKASGGIFTVESTLGGLQGFGTPGGASDVKTVEQIDAHGKVLKAEVEGGKGQSNPLGNQMSTTQGLPDHPVKIGDTWTTSKGAAGTATYKLVKVEDQGGVQVATIQISNMKIPNKMGAKVKLASPATIVVELQTGTLHSMNMDMAMEMASKASQPGVKMKMHLKIERQ